MEVECYLQGTDFKALSNMGKVEPGKFIEDLPKD